MASEFTSADPIDIHLPSGLMLRDAVGMLTAKFRQWDWDRYDGNRVRDPQTVTGEDVEISFSGAKARTSVNHVDYKENIAKRQDELSEFLKEIPVGVAIEGDGDTLDALRKPIVGLYDCLTAIPGVGLANATKLTHRHRPAFFVLLDSAIRKYYWSSTSIRDEERFLRLKRLGWGEYAFALLELFREDLCAVEVMDKIDQVRDAVREQRFASISRARLLESLIWYYYFGR
jgi:hypothetical protein